MRASRWAGWPDAPAPTSLTVAPASVAADQTVTASWQTVAAPAPRDWLGLYPVGARDRDYVAWQYVGCGTPPTAGQASGSCDFVAPAKPGTYEVRIFTADTFKRLATSGPLVVESPTPTES